MFTLNGNHYIIVDLPENTSTQESMLCCRACLSTDARLFNIHDYKLADTFSWVSGTPIFRDPLPQYLCSYCRALLLKFASFRAMCVRTQQHLMTELLSGQLNMASIQRINEPIRFLNLTQTGVEIIDSTPFAGNLSITEAPDKTNVENPLTDDIHIKHTTIEDLNNILNTGLDIKVEPVIEIVEINDILKNTDQIKLDNKMVNSSTAIVGCDHQEVLPGTPMKATADSLAKAIRTYTGPRNNHNRLASGGQHTPSKRVSKVKDKDITDKAKNVRKQEKETGKIKTITNTNAVIEERTSNNDTISSLPESNIGIDVDDNDEIGDVGDASSIEHELNLNDVSCVKKATVKKRKVIIEKEKKTNVKKKMKYNYNDDNDTIEFCNMVKEKEKEWKEKDQKMKDEAFERDFSVKIALLSKEEQLAEIAARKQTRNYQESYFKCEECYKGFEFQDTYDNHMQRHAPSRGPHLCEVCRVRFKNNWQLLKHRENHRNKICCTQCGFVSQTKSQAKLHYAVHAGQIYNCPHCWKCFKKKSTFLSHVRLGHPALSLACDRCGEGYVSSKGLNMHKARMHSEKHKCTVCSATFISVEALNRHTDTAGEHKDLRPCEQCGENCASEDALHDHVKEKHSKKSHRCEECDMAFPTREAHNTHFVRKHLEQGFKKTVRRVLKRPRRKTETSSNKQYVCEQYVCEQCGRMFPRWSSLWTHQRSHLTIKPYACDHCSKAFALKEVLIGHLRSHSGEKPFQCKDCPLRFSHKGNLDRHHRAVHLGIRDCFTCDICGSTATTKSSLRIHVDSKHGGKGWPKSQKRKMAAANRR